MAKTTGLASISKGKSEVHLIDPRQIKIRKGWNFRDFNDAENAEHVENLYQSIREVGVKEPLTVTFEKGECWLDNGECRLKAALLVIDRDKQEIRVPVRSEDRYANEIDRLINQRVRNSGKPFTVLEDAAFMKKLVDMGMQQGEIAKKCNISAARVSQILEYNRIGTVGRELIQTGQASASLVMEVTKNEGTDAEKALLDGMKAAKKNGHVKLKPDDVKGARVNISKAVRDAFEYADVDDTDDEMVVVKFPVDKWEAIRQVLKL